MYLTTTEYLQLLRQGDLVRALQWGDFLVKKYASKTLKAFDADMMINLAVFELINSDFSPKDFSWIRIVYLLMIDESGIFKEITAYYAQVLFNAAVQYQVLYEENLLSDYCSSETLTCERIFELFQKENTKLDSAENSRLLKQKVENLIKELAKSKKEAATIKEKILYIYYYQENLQLYVDELVKDTSNEKSVAERLGLARSLHDFLVLQTITTEEVTERVADFIDALRGLEPYEWEDEFLQKLIPKTFTQRLWDSSKSAFLFFSGYLFEGMLPSLENVSKSTLTDSAEFPSFRPTGSSSD